MMTGKKIRHLNLLYFAADFTAIVSAYYATVWLRFNSTWGLRFFTAMNRALGVRESGELGDAFEEFYVLSAPRIIIILTATLCTIYALRNLYSSFRFLRQRPVAWNVFLANITALGFFYAYWYLQRNIFHPRSFFVTLLALNIVFCVGLRSRLDSVLNRLREQFGVDRRQVILVGETAEADFMNILIEEIHPHGIYVQNRVVFDPGKPFDEFLRSLESAIAEHQADMVICAENRFSINQIMRLLQLTEKLIKPVWILSDKLGVLVESARLPTDMIRGIPLVYFGPASDEGYSSVMKHVVSFIMAAFSLILLSPLFLLLAVLIKATSQGPVLFVQERIGINRKPFRMYKFRTMYHRADELQAELEPFNETGPGLFKIRKDPRVTPVGRLLRRFSLDELPQLFNVLRGDMNLVGPRPLPRRDFENYYEDWHYSRHGGLPGLTCLWQVSGRSDIDFHNMCILDIYYLRNRRWVMDVQIILRTFWMLLFGKGAY